MKSPAIYEDAFTHDCKVYDLNKTKKLMRNKLVFHLPIIDLLWVLKYDKPAEDRITKAKLRYPLLVAKYHNRVAVVDGLHRLEKYRRMGAMIIPVREVPPDVLDLVYLRPT